MDSMNLKEKIRYYLIDSKGKYGRILDITLILLNVFIVAIFIIETYQISDLTRKILDTSEFIIVGFFIIEYAARLYAARNRLKYIFNPYSIIDFVAIIPTVLQLFIGPGNINILKLLRMFRVFRVLRFLRFFETADFFFGRISLELLTVLRLIMTVFMIFFVSAGLFYVAEYSSNPKVSNFGDAFYFTVVALTTVGFGDIIPVTGAGKAVTVLCILSGIVLIPWQLGQVIKMWIHISRQDPVICGNCGLKYHDRDAVHCKACGHVIYQECENE